MTLGPARRPLCLWHAAVLLIASSIAVGGPRQFAPSPSFAQPETLPPRLPLIFSMLEGAWEGSGVLMGRPAAFTMRWEAVGRDFVRLSFSNSWTDDSGNMVPVLSSQATYLLRESAAIGVWIDDRPRRVTLEAAITDSSVVTRWTAPSEQGRTEYLLRSPDTVRVRDFVLVDAAERLFAEATYQRIVAESHE